MSMPDTDYEALVAEAREYAEGGWFAAPRFERLADAVEALVEDRDGWRDAALTYKASRGASDARAEALAAERDALRAQLDNMAVEYAYHGTYHHIREQRLVSPWTAVEEGDNQ